MVLTGCGDVLWVYPEVTIGMLWVAPELCYPVYCPVCVYSHPLHPVTLFPLSFGPSLCLSLSLPSPAALTQAGQQMEDSVVAAYCALVLGLLAKHNLVSDTTHTHTPFLRISYFLGNNYCQTRLPYKLYASIFGVLAYIFCLCKG